MPRFPPLRPLVEVSAPKKSCSDSRCKKKCPLFCYNNNNINNNKGLPTIESIFLLSDWKRTWPDPAAASKFPFQRSPSTITSRDPDYYWVFFIIAHCWQLCPEPPAP